MSEAHSVHCFKRSLHDEMLFLFAEAKRDALLEHVKFDIFGDEIANSEMIRGALEVN